MTDLAFDDLGKIRILQQTIWEDSEKTKDESKEFLNCIAFIHFLHVY